MKRSVAVLLLLCACGRGPDHERGPSFSVAAAESVAMRYVNYDTTGNWRAANSLVLPCEGDQARDYIAVTRSIGWLPSQAHGDTIQATALYSVIGHLWSYDPNKWRFTSAGGPDTSVFAIVADSTGQLRIVCGPFSSNHRMMTSMADIVKWFDDSSRAKWNRAVSVH